MDGKLRKKRYFACAKKIVSGALLLTFLLGDGSAVPGVKDSLPVLVVERALALAGDFATFRNNSDTTTVPTGNSEVELSWDTVVSSNANIALLPGNTTIDLVEGGKYLVLYNVWTEETGSGGENRRAFASYLTVNESPLMYGRGAGYIRDNNGDDNYAYTNGAAIIDVSAGDDLKINVRRDDTNGDNQTRLRAGTNGVSVLKLKDDFDYARIPKIVNSGNISGVTTFTGVTWNTADELDTGSFGYTSGSADITLKGNEGDYYLVTYNVRLEQTAGSGERQNYESRLTLGGVEVPGTRVSTYPRGDANSNGINYGTLAYSGLVRKTAAGDQVLNIEVRQENADDGTPPATVIVGNETAIAIAALPSTAHYVSLTATTSQSVPNTQSPIDFDERLEVESAAFSHSTTTNPSRINIDLAGDYLFFSTLYAERSGTSADRDPYRVEWRLDGSNTLQYGGHGSFLRGNQGSQSSYAAGSSGGVILNGLTDTQYLEVTMYDEEDNADANLNPARIAIQGVELAHLFQTDVEVAATGTHKASVGVPEIDVYQGGVYVISENTSGRNVTTVTLTESGSIDAANALDNIRLYYDLDISDPYDCTSESFSGTSTESQFGVTDTNGFSGANGVSSFTSTVGIDTDQTLCLYVVYDTTEQASDGDTVSISIADPTTDVSVTSGGSVGPTSAQAPTGNTVARNAELTQVHYHWLNDDGGEGSATSIEGAEDTPTGGFANGTVRRLRLQVSAEGSTSSTPTALRLEYAAKSSTCDAASGWTDVGAGGGDWDMSDTTYFASDGLNSSDLSVANGGTTNENTTHLPSNGALKDTSSQISTNTFTSANFLEAEFAIEPTVTAPQGTTYCFRLTDAGTPLRGYDVYPEGTLSADVVVSASSSQVASLDVGSTVQYVGGTFVVERPGSARTLTSMTFTETGTVDATLLTNPRLYFDLSTTSPYDCTGESYAPSDSYVSGSAFTGANGSTTFTGSVSIDSTQAFCGYVVFDISAAAVDGDTVNIEISDPSTDVVVTSSSVGPSAPISPTGSTTLAGHILTQTHYHWRNDDDTEADATSATGGNEDTALSDLPKETTYRLRLQVSNEGSVAAPASSFRLEYGTKISSCDVVGAWTDVGAGGGAWDMSLSSNIADGNTSNILTAGLGAMTDENSVFDGVGSLRETTSDSGAITLNNNEFTELEYSIEATADAGYNTTYCFRVTDQGTPLPAYEQYAEVTTREKQDFFVQRDTEIISGTSLTLIAGSDYTAPASTSSAFVRITSSQHTGAGNNTGGGNQNADDVTAFISDQSDLTSSFTISRPSTAASVTRVDWEIVEYIGLPGADNEIVVRDVGTVTYGGSSQVATGSAVAAVDTDADVVVFITGLLNPNAGTTYMPGQSTSHWSAATDEPVFTRGQTGSVAAEVSYAVVEFTGQNWKVQRVEHAYTGAPGTTESEPIVALNSLQRTFVHAQKRVAGSATGLDDYGHQVWLSSIGAVSFQLNSGADAAGDHTSVAWVIENTQSGNGAMYVYRISSSLDANEAVEPRTTSVSIGGTLGQESNGSLFISNDTTGPGTAYPRAMLGATIASTTHFELFESDAGQTQTYRVEIVEWPVAEVALRQNYYRFYVDNDQIDPTDVWPVGASDLGENTTITASDDPLGDGERVRLRTTLVVSNANLPAAVASFKLQYGKMDTTCSAITVWTDVGAPGSGAIWRGYNGAPVDGTELATSTPAAGRLNISISDVAGTYEESNNSAVNPYSVAVGEDVEYDWVIEHNGAAQRTDYCFRMVYSDDTELAGYNHYPTLRTTGYTPITDTWRWYDDEVNPTPTTALAAENVSPIDVANENVIKLRVLVPEVENAVGTNIKFALQYSEYADFADGGRFLTSTSSCLENSLWCYADGGGIDNAVISTTTLTGAAACSDGVGIGCGTHNEAATTTSTFTHAAGAATEFEFTIQNAGARVNAVYYFRLYDVNFDQPLVASSTYPSLVTEGAQLVSTLSGVTSGTSMAGVTADVSTTPTAIGFGSLPFASSYEAIQQLTINTNATEGYQVLMYASQQLTNAYGDTIPFITASNTAPAAWSTACSGSAVGCFGYHTTDATLEGGSGRFGPIDTYAALETVPREVMYSSIPTDDTEYIIFRVQVGELQVAGEYETNIVYLSIPVF